MFATHVLYSLGFITIPYISAVLITIIIITIIIKIKKDYTEMMISFGDIEILK